MRHSLARRSYADECTLSLSRLVSSLACTHTVYTDTSTFQTCTKVASAEGIFSLWYGFLPYYGRCGGHTVAMFVAVDQIRTIYRKMMMGEK